MSLLEDLKDYYTEEKSPPEGPEVDAELVHSEYTDSLRWGLAFTNVYKRGDEYVAVEDVEPATEMQDWGDYGEPNLVQVYPAQVTITKYRRVKE